MMDRFSLPLHEYIYIYIYIFKFGSMHNIPRIKLLVSSAVFFPAELLWFHPRTPRTLDKTILITQTENNVLHPPDLLATLAPVYTHMPLFAPLNIPKTNHICTFSAGTQGAFNGSRWSLFIQRLFFRQPFNQEPTSGRLSLHFHRLETPFQRVP